ncbi:DHH phosphoesterase [Eremomyces bilateralis CBS 781.70]|uniref:DHH phosphoesterase n=1 Tax=Eremomyces bilateralis CBS 781.70 TaxID=1392243 RepID=A0A6G1FVG1_9PEZI|nr:DHH phosphoesterase [Eremomyces bilateralis CBS 781.70]KAF1809698.1 DHH phosphoesterase [Eremomyces bilateralis CBS 781.70]
MSTSQSQVNDPAPGDDPMRIPSLHRFLGLAKSALRQPGKKTFVVGNESVDLDTLTSSLLLSYLRSYPIGKTDRSQISGAIPGSHPLTIPLIPLPRADLRLRPEFIPVLQSAGAEVDDLITLDDLEAPVSYGRAEAQEPPDLILVDHNAPTGAVKALNGKVIGCIDHHVDEGVVSNDAEPRIVEMAGNCGSLVLDWAVKSGLWEEDQARLTSGEDAWTVAGLAKMAMASILVDTTNLKAKEKVKEVDEWAVGYLESVIQAVETRGVRLGEADSERYGRDRWHKLVNGIKKELKGLSAEEMLRKDYKEWEEKDGKVGIASVVKPLAEIIDRASPQTRDERGMEALAHISEAFAKTRGLDLFVVMTTFKDTHKQFRRELMLMAISERMQSLLGGFQEKSEELQLEAWQADERMTAAVRHMGMKVWMQGNTSWSRKQVAPFIRGLLKDA